MWQRSAAIPSASWSCGRDPLGGSSGDTGNCLLYDTAKLRQRIYGTSLGIKWLDMLLAVILYIFIRKRTFDTESEADNEEEVKSGTEDVYAKVDWSAVKESDC